LIVSLRPYNQANILVIRSLVQMNNNSNNSELNNPICEAVDCIQEATVEVNVRVGHNSTLTLNLCKKCVAWFQESGEILSNDSMRYSTQ